MNPTNDISSNVVDIIIDSSNNEPLIQDTPAELEDIAIDISLSNHSTTSDVPPQDSKSKKYAFKSDIENGLNDMPYSLKVRTSNLANSAMMYPPNSPFDNNGPSSSQKFNRLVQVTAPPYPHTKLTKSAVRMRSTFRSVLKDVSDRTSVSDYYTNEQKSMWLNNTKVPQISIADYFMFYFNSLRNNKQYKFRYIEFVGELKTINEFCDNIIGMLLDQLEEEDSVVSIGDTEDDILYFLNIYDDKLTQCFYKIDSFLTDNIGFMKLCSAPVDLFLDKYYSARNNSCGLIKHTDFSSSYDWLCREEIKVNNYYIPYIDCVDKHVKETYIQDLEEEIYMHCSTKKNVSIRRIAAIHTLFGELRALCEFIKTTIELNDQLLFKVIMLCGNFLVLLGEYVWNTTLKQRYTE